MARKKVNRHFSFSYDQAVIALRVLDSGITKLSRELGVTPSAVYFAARYPNDSTRIAAILERKIEQARKIIIESFENAA